MYIADMHCDTIMLIWLARREGKEAYLRDASVDGKSLQIDLLKLKEGGSLVQNFALYADLQMEDGTSPWTQFKEMAEIYHAEIAANPDLVREARSYEDIIRKDSKLDDRTMQAQRICCACRCADGYRCA